MSLRIIGLVGSMRRHGNTEVAVHAILDGAAETTGVETTLIALRDYHIEFCRGCFEVHSKDEHPCVIKDDMAGLREALLAADAIVFGSPSYFGGLSGLLRTFLDRTGPVWGRLRGKLAGIVALGEDRFGGQELVVQEIAHFCRSHRLEVAEWPLCLQTPPGNGAGSLAGDADAMEQCAALGRSIVAQLQGRSNPS
jgi:multimeric flavodoxin WrbA